MFSFIINNQSVFDVTILFCIPTRNEGKFLLFISSSAFGGVSILEISHSIGFNLHFPQDI